MYMHSIVNTVYEPAMQCTHVHSLHVHASHSVVFHPFRREFAEYLCRPDHKQEFISQWQSTYNGLEPHLRREESMKAELHHRVDVSR